MTTIGGLIGLAAQTPVGAAIDATAAKRGVIVAALVVVALGAITIFAAPIFWPVLIANIAMAVIGDVFGPAVAALTLGLFSHGQLASRIGRNGAFDHAGNVAIAFVAGGTPCSNPDFATRAQNPSSGARRSGWSLRLARAPTQGKLRLLDHRGAARILTFIKLYRFVNAIAGAPTTSTRLPCQ